MGDSSEWNVRAQVCLYREKWVMCSVLFHSSDQSKRCDQIRSCDSDQSEKNATE